MLVRSLYIIVAAVSLGVNAVSFDEELVRGKTYLNIGDRLAEITPAEARGYFNGLVWMDGEHDADFPPLVIKKINDAVGFGLFAGADIKKGDPVFSYRGRRSSQPISNLYSLAVKLDTLYIDAQLCGNAARFASHLPVSLEDYEFDPAVDMNQVARANVMLSNYLHDGFPLFVATNDIQKGEIIGYDYGLQYCISMAQKFRQQVELFFKDGQVVPREKFMPESISILTEAPWKGLAPNLWQGTRDEMREIMEGNEAVLFGVPSDMAISRATLLRKFESRDSIWILADETCLQCGICKRQSFFCGNCKWAHYCSRECQREDWPKHKPNCSKH